MNVPVPVLLIETLPVGVIDVAVEVSVTVTVHIMLLLTFEQLTMVELVRFVTVRLNEPKLPE